MKKIGIISMNMHTYRLNYGSVLQSYAMQTVLENMVRDKACVEIVDYTPYYQKDVNNKYVFSTVKNRGLLPRLQAIVATPMGVRAYHKFQRFFREQYHVGKNKYYWDSEDINGYDAFVCGSDTIWCVDQTKVFDRAFFADFPSMRHHTISYAASFGETIIDQTKQEQFHQYIRNFAMCSIREPKNLSSFGDITPNVVLDPTLMLDASYYTRLAKYNKSGGYILVYALTSNRELDRRINHFATEKKLKIVEISRFMINGLHREMRLDAGIEEWLGYIQNAEYVFVNSFHGAVFSILFHKKFFAYTRADAKDKMYHLLGLFGLEDRLITEKTFCDTEIDYTSVDEKLNHLRASSYQYLERALNEVGIYAIHY